MPLVTVEAEAWPPRVRIAAGFNGVTRTGPDGVPVEVRGSGLEDVLYDYEAPQEVALTYVVGGVTTEVVSMPDIGAWLVHLTEPELSVPLTVNLTAAVETAGTVKSLPLLGRAPHTVATGRTTRSSSMTVHTFTADEADALEALLRDESVLWLSTPTRMGWGPWYVRFLDVSVTRTADRTDHPNRVSSLPFLVQDRPTIIDAGLTLWEQMPNDFSGLPETWAGMPG